MNNFRSHYRSLFKAFGYPLTPRTAIPSKQIAKAEKRLGMRVPKALRDYYLIAGRERRFNQPYCRLLAPNKWFVDKQHLIFMEEYQNVLWWGVSLRNPRSDDPQISQGLNLEPISWHSERCKCSVFLTFMLCYQGINGGFPYLNSADAPDQTNYRFERQGWADHGEVGAVRAYSRKNQVVCLMPPGNLLFMQKLRVVTGAKTQRLIKSLGDEIGLTWDSPTTLP
ncbi:MAG: hypothetical protein K8T25_09865 [Planctomycetia bacterium]|nr:hypothetical protein [Planctomycetia bacterium]